MPLKSGRLTPPEQTFASVYAMTGDGTYAATCAGYKHPHQNAAKLLKRPTVTAEIVEQQVAVLSNEILPLAISAHRRLLADERTPAGALVQAIRLAYDRALGAQAERQDREPWEMSAEELAAAIANLERLKSDRAKPVLDGEVVADVFD